MKTTKRSWVLLVFAASVVAVCHWVAQWLAWATHPGNSAVPPSGSAIPWLLLSFPLFYVVPSTVASGAAFSAILAGNSLLWGTAVAAGYRTMRPYASAATRQTK